MRVLYVDDDRINSLLFEHACLRLPDLDLQCADTQEAALSIAQTWKPELLVLDMHLAETTGIALLQQLRKLPHLTHVPAVLCSADADWSPEAAAAGFQTRWNKPVLPDDLIKNLERLNGHPNELTDELSR